MTYEDPHTYCVDNGEDAFILITPMDGAIGERAIAAIDGKALEKTLDGLPMRNLHSLRRLITQSHGCLVLLRRD